MTTFMCVHSVPPQSMTFQQVSDIARLTQRDPAVKGRRSFGNLTEGKLVCVLEANNKQDLVNFFRRNNVPFDTITEVEFEGEGGVLTPIAPSLAGARP